MNALLKVPEINHNSYLPVFVDISKDHLDYAVGWEPLHESAPARRVTYRVESPQRWIQELITAYQLPHARHLQFVCELTGGL